MSNKIIGEISQPYDLRVKLQNDNEIKVNIIGGARGKSAYELWLAQGNIGTVEDFIQDIRGKDGGAYIHPETHLADMIVETEERQFISIEDKLKLSGYIHDQIPSSEIWIVHHTLDKFPSVSVVDTGGNLVVGNVEYMTKHELKIIFTSEFSGKAYLN